MLRQVSRDLEPGGLAGTLIDLATLQFLPYPLRGLIVGGIGVLLVVIGAVRVIRAFMGPFRSADGDQPLVELIYQRRFLARGPRIVAIGGGTGLSMLLRGLKEHTSNLTAVVTVADDGGSSGRAPPRARDPAGRRHPQLHRGARRRRTADERAAPVPVPGDRRHRRRRLGSGRTRRRQSAHRGHDRRRGRRFRGGRPSDQPDPCRPRSGPAGDGDAADPARPARRRVGRSTASPGSCGRSGSIGSG